MVQGGFVTPLSEMCLDADKAVAQGEGWEVLAAQHITSLTHEYWKMKGMILTLLINDLNIWCGIHSTCIRTPAKGCA